MSDKTGPVLFETVRQIRVVTLIGHRDVDFWDVTEAAHEKGWSKRIGCVYVGAELAKAFDGKVGELLTLAKKRINQAHNRDEWMALEDYFSHVDARWRGQEIRLILDMETPGYRIDLRSKLSKKTAGKGL